MEVLQYLVRLFPLVSIACKTYTDRFTRRLHALRRAEGAEPCAPGRARLDPQGSRQRVHLARAGLHQHLRPHGTDSGHEPEQEEINILE